MTRDRTQRRSKEEVLVSLAEEWMRLLNATKPDGNYQFSDEEINSQFEDGPQLADVGGLSLS